jgi:hypothetical protein
MNKLKVGDRVRNIRVKIYKDEPIEVIDVYRTRYNIKYLNVFNRIGDNMTSWVDEDDITLDIEYYRDLKLEKILNE